MGISRVRFMACAAAAARPVTAIAVEYLWIASDLIKQPPPLLFARCVPVVGPVFDVDECCRSQHIFGEHRIVNMKQLILFYLF
jgi:hypothetical protein